MNITSYEDLKHWFDTIQKEDKPYPHWTLWNNDAGQAPKVAQRNVRVNDIGQSWDMLYKAVRMFNNPRGSRMRLIVYEPGKQNNYAGDINLEILGDTSATAAAHNMPVAISGFPGMYGPENMKDAIDMHVRLAMLEKENEDLQAAIGAPSSSWEKIVEMVANSPHLSAIVNNMVAGVMKIPPQAMPAMPAPPINGHPTTDESAHAEADAQQVFSNNIHAASNTLGVDPVTLAQKLNDLVQQNPDIARQLLNA